MPDAGENAAIQQKRVFTQPELKAVIRMRIVLRC